MMPLDGFPAETINQSGATDTQGLVWSDALNMWVPGSVVRGLTSADASVTITDNGDGTLDLAAAGGGGGGGSAYHGVKAVRSAPQSIGVAGAVLSCTGVDAWDTDGYHDPAGANPDRITVPTGLGGHYRVTVHTEQADTTTYNHFVIVQVNGATYVNLIAVGANNTNAQFRSASEELLLAAGDYVTVKVVNSSTASIQGHVVLSLLGA